MISAWLNKRDLLKQATRYSGKDNNLSFNKAQLDIYNIRKKTCDILVTSLNSDSFVQVQNTLIILKRLEDLFPSVKHLGKRILENVNKIKSRFDAKVYGSLLLMTENYSKIIERKIKLELTEINLDQLKMSVRKEN